MLAKLEEPLEKQLRNYLKILGVILRAARERDEFGGSIDHRKVCELEQKKKKILEYTEKNIHVKSVRKHAHKRILDFSAHFYAI